MKQKSMLSAEINQKMANFGELYVKRFMNNKGFELVGEHIRNYGFEVDLVFRDRKSGVSYVTEVKTRGVENFSVIYETLERERPSIWKKRGLLFRYIDKVVSCETAAVRLLYFYVFVLVREGEGFMRAKMVEIVF